MGKPEYLIQQGEFDERSLAKAVRDRFYSPLQFTIHRTLLPVIVCLFVVCGCSSPLPTVTEPHPTANNATAALVAPSPTPEPTQIPPPPLPKKEVRTNSNNDSLMYHDIPYNVDGDIQQQLSIFLPLEVQNHPDKKYPVLFLFHFWEGSKEGSLMMDAMQYANQYGIAAVSVDYRDDITNGNPWNALNDGACALGWLYSHAGDYNLDVKRMVAFGHSYGAVIATDLALASDPNIFLSDCPYTIPSMKPFRGVIPFAIGTFYVPGDDLTFSAENELFKSYWVDIIHAADTEKEMIEILNSLTKLPPDEWSEASELSAEARAFAQTTPAYWLDASDPPFLLLYPENDAYWSEGEYEAFTELLEEVGVSFTYRILPSSSHFDWSISDPKTWQEPIGNFLDNLLFEGIKLS